MIFAAGFKILYQISSHPLLSLWAMHLSAYVQIFIIFLSFCNLFISSLTKNVLLKKPYFSNFSHMVIRLVDWFLSLSVILRIKIASGCHKQCEIISLSS